MSGSKAPRASPTNDQDKLDAILSRMSEVGFSLGKFLHHLFGEFTKDELKLPKNRSFVKRSPQHAKHPDGAPTQHRATAEHAALPNKDATPMARHQLKLWAIDTASKVIEAEARTLDKAIELRMPPNRENWQAVVDFSLAGLQQCIQRDAPMLYRLVLTAATSPADARRHSEGAVGLLGDTPQSRGPSLVVVPAILMLMNSRNIRANYFQKVIGVWLFSCQAPAQIYENLNRMGVSVSYNTVTKLLHQLAESATTATQKVATYWCFLIVIDNINRLRKFWNPRLRQQDIMMSGAASTLVEMRGVPPHAFELRPYYDARSQQLRTQLTPSMLWSRIDQHHLRSVLALHCVNILSSHCPSLSTLLSYVTNELQTTYAIHRMPDGAITKCHPLSSTSLEQGSAEGCGNNLREILLNQLKLPAELVSEMFIIISGDLGTIEKLCALMALESSCKHKFPSFSWVLPLVQLWHMGWADLSCLTSTHWGQPATKDPSSLWHKCALLGRNVKPADRPDYYSTQTLIFDVLEADVLDCWRLLLGVQNIQEHFQNAPTLPTGPELFEQARILVSRWASTRAREAALTSPEYWDGPNEQSDGLSDADSDTPLVNLQATRRNQTRNPAQSHDSVSRKSYDPDIPFEGDERPANSIQRMEESLIHREFAWAVADGDIGRVMQVMNVWLFTFTGANKSKYANELLELACGFTFEFPEALQTAIKNNWLCNFSGLKGCWMPMDLMQEHHIRELKDKAQRRDTDFESAFFQHVISRNIRWFAATRTSVTKALNNERDTLSSAHSKSNNSAAISRLLVSLELERVHTFIPGRSHGWLSRDNCTEGRRSMPAKLQHFLRRTAQATSGLDLEDEEEADNAREEPEYDRIEPPAPGMIIDGRYIPGEVEDPNLDEGGNLEETGETPEGL